MHDKLFSAPVAVSVGVGVRRDLYSLADMHEFLIEWSPSRRRISYGAAVKACEAAIAGDISPASARDALTAFAETAGILWPDGLLPVAINPAARSYAGVAA